VAAALPDRASDFARVRRVELYDKDMNLFR